MDSKQLPSDIIFEILTRITSLKTLDTCKSVCKSWNKLIQEPRFMPLYRQRTRNLSGYFILNKLERKCLTMFVSIDQLHEQKGTSESSSSSCSSSICMERFPNDFRILASCNQGLLCCVSRLMYYVCKPATRQWQLLPSPEIHHPTVAVTIMVLSSSPLRYKIVRLTDRGIDGLIQMYKCEIFDSKIWTWQETQYILLPRDELILGSSTSVSITNTIYWLTSRDNVLAYHVSKGMFQTFPLPKEVVEDEKKYSYKYKKLMEYEGRLGLIICNTKKEGDTELWITYENPRNCTNWSEKMVMSRENVVRSGTQCPLFDGFYNDSIAFLKAFHDVVPCNPEECGLSKVDPNYDLKFAREIFWVRSDSEGVNLGRDGCVEGRATIWKEMVIIMFLVLISMVLKYGHKDCIAFLLFLLD